MPEVREIKFRVWYFEKEKWIEDDILNGPQLLNNIFSSAQEGYVFQQYTGLKDKNGKEIYEGDIVCRHNISKEVKWQMGKSYCGWNIGVGYFYNSKSAIEVIGNIYENPELIKQ